MCQQDEFCLWHMLLVFHFILMSDDQTLFTHCIFFNSPGSIQPLLHFAQLANLLPYWLTPFYFYGSKRQTRQFLIWSMCGQRQAPNHIDRPVRGSNPRPSGKHSTESPVLMSAFVSETYNNCKTNMVCFSMLYVKLIFFHNSPRFLFLC